MPVIPGCRWIQQNTQVINNDINTAQSINASLVLDKFVTWTSLDFSSAPEPKPDKRHFEKIKKVSATNSLLNNSNYSHLKQRRYILNNVVTFPLTTQTRLIVNHGGESILDNSIALHPYYGFPVIPATAVKGVTRHFCEEFLKLHENNRNLYLRIFGNKPGHKDAREGEIIFFDAWPTSIGSYLELDIFTPHYQKYYEGNALPMDNQNPVPIPFLAVRKGISFEFAIVPSSNHKGNDTDQFLDQIKGYIIEALKTFGIGAKTGSSYGYFE
ncbi:MAG: type III-B CRISPR module RAMP protein Cmr6 [Deltaproteobacteria bacterium]|nr:type III-B CRISPR module RAMP protein Cmr6 [Deltaproteobacteria bacterium]